MARHQDLTNWRQVKNLENARTLVDTGVLLNIKDAKNMKKSFSELDCVALTRHFTVTFCERSQDRLACEIILESLLSWMIATKVSEDLVDAFLEEIFEHQYRAEACIALSEVSVSAAFVHGQDGDDYLAVCVALMCELGMAIRAFDEEFPGEFKKAKGILAHMDNYLLSLGNSTSTAVRLSLLHYMGTLCAETKQQEPFNRVMSRFGYTAYETLFNLLSQKKTEGVALQYLQESIPFVLHGDASSQYIFSNTFKAFMLRKPEKFSMFLFALTETILDHEHSSAIRGTFLQHLAQLYTHAADVNQKELARDILNAFQKFKEEPELPQLLTLLKQAPLRQSFKHFLVQFQQTDDMTALTMGALKTKRRGRKASFAKTEQLGVISQIAWLGEASDAA
ncbi:MAG: hypothetical protein AB8C84_00515 [Oligoflexales bacterium]